MNGFCDVAGFSDYSLLETAIRSRCCPENRAICSDVWKRHLLAPATRHTTYRIKAEDNKRHTRLQPRQFTERTTAAQLLDTESGMRRERETRESSTIHHPTSCQLFPEPIRHFRSIPIYPTQRSSPEGSLVHV